MKPGRGDSLVDVLWASIQSIAQPSFFSGLSEGVACVLPILQTLFSVVGSGGEAGTVLLSQTGFWQHIHVVWDAVIHDVDRYPDVSSNFASMEAAATIVDMVNFVLHQHWHSPSERLDAAGELPIVCKESELGPLLHGENKSKFPSAGIPVELLTLFEKVCSTSSSTGNWLHGCLEHWGPKDVHNLFKEGEVALIKATQAAALLVCARVLFKQHLQRFCTS